ncbi:hypothetical protein D9613_012770 [Agrocybe pediades]|uniref:AB hydrolase-1 domain-containing protein n=1 Tax=Agrocybe pediades TaxID=84607 RepID=A0A8H4VK29_9AGAR|nr:hypothetical protein D9613_012770 [Agrocybe pediades]
MPTISLNETTQYFYTDTGVPPDDLNYKTLLIIHGHTFHSGSFRRIASIAPSKSMRIVCVNRRGYPGTSPYTEAQKKAIVSGTDDERSNVLQQLGTELALFIDALIRECSISSNGGITVAGWSMGAMFVFALMTSTEFVGKAVGHNLRTYLKGFILWDPPIHALGAPDIPDRYIPLWDSSIQESQRGTIFATWLSSYFAHKDISSRDLDDLSLREPDHSKSPTIQNMTLDELSSMIELTSKGEHDYESIMVMSGFMPAVYRHTTKALFDRPEELPLTKLPVVHLLGACATWNIIYSAWFLQDMVSQLNGAQDPIKLKIMPEFNHFAMWDKPDATLNALQECLG